MTADAMTIDVPAVGRAPGGPFLGFRTALRKELTEWLHGPRLLIVTGISVVVAIFTTFLTRIELATTDPGEVLDLSMDPTVNTLLGWTGQGLGIIAIIATMTAISVERDRGTLAWSLTNPVSPTSILAAKYVAAMLFFSVATVVLPMVVSVATATVAYGELPDLTTVAVFSVLFLAVPAFFLALTIGLGAGIRSTAGIAGIAIAVLLIPQMLGGLVPFVQDLSPTFIGRWAQAVVMDEPAPLTIPIAWAISMVAILVGAKLVFDRQEF